MALRYSGPEVMEMAVETERGGKLFYDRVAEKTASEELRKLFRYLGDEEAKHIAVFQDIARSITERPEEMPYQWEEAVPYLDAIVESRYFLGEDKALALARDSATQQAAVEHALGFEKETLLFYTELLAMVTEHIRPAVARLIAEEKTHVVRLKRLRDALGK